MREAVLSIVARRTRKIAVLQARKSSTKFAVDLEKVVEAEYVPGDC